MRLITLLCATCLLCSCGATGKLVGTVATLPVRVLSGGMKFNDDGMATNVPMMQFDDAQNLSDL